MAIPTGFGLGIPHQTIDSGMVALNGILGTFRPKWWHNWKSDHLGKPGYVPSIWKPIPGNAQWNDAVADVLATGRFYMLGNEVNNPNEAYMTPQAAVEAEGAWRAAINHKVDGQWVFPAWAGFGLLVDGESGTWKPWIEEFLSLGGKRPHTWHIHIYATNGDDFRAKWGYFTSWLYQHKDGPWQTLRPVIITEFGPYSGYAVNGAEIMDAAIEKMNASNLLHAVCYFSALYGPFSSNWKTTDAMPYNEVDGMKYVPVTMTNLGQAFQQRAWQQ